MFTIKIFLASSCELANERMIIGDAIRKADDEWRPKGVRLQLMVWEDYRPEFLGERTQTEYDKYLVEESQIVVGLFKNRCGKYTQEELMLAKSKNSRNLHVFSLSGNATPDLVHDFLTRESIGYKKCDEISEVCSEVKLIIEDYITNNVDKGNLNVNSALAAERVYATVGVDIKERYAELGNTVRSVNDALEDDNISRCVLMEPYRKENIAQADYYVALTHECCDGNEEEEVVTAINLAAAAKGKLPVAIYVEKGKDFLKNCPKIGEAVDAFGVFPIDYRNMNDVKTNMFLYFYRKRKGEGVVFDEISGFAYSDGAVTFAGHRIADVKELFKDDELYEQCKQLDGVQKQIDSLVHRNDAENRNRKVILNKKKSALLNYVNEVLTLKFALLQSGYIRTGIDVSRPLDMESVRNIIETQRKAWAVLQEKKENLLDDWTDTLRMLVARLNFLVAGKALEIKEVRGSAKTIYDLLQCIIDKDAKVANECMLDIMQLLQATYSRYGGDYSEDDFFLMVVNWADRHHITTSYFIELCRFNYANALTRNEDSAALQWYEKLLANLKRMDDNSISSHRFITKAYASIVHTLIELEDDGRVLEIVTQMGSEINRWHDVSKEHLWQNSEYYAALLKVLPMYWDDDMQEIILSASEAFMECKERLTLSPKDYYYVSCFCLLPNIIAAFIIDRIEKMDELNKKTFVPRASEMLDDFLDYAKRMEDYDPIEGMQSASEGYHNRGFLYYKLRRQDDAIAEYRKALELRRSIYEYSNEKIWKRAVGDTLVNIGAAQLEWCKENGSLKGHNPMDTAKEALEIYESLYNKDYPHSEVDIYKAKQLLATSYYYVGTPEQKNRGLEMMMEIFDWVKVHPKNSYKRSFSENTQKILNAEKKIE